MLRYPYMPNKLSLIVPAYNEESRLGKFLETVVAYDREHPQGIIEILIVDDGSSDKTRQVAEGYQKKLPKIAVLSHEQNKGKGAAVRTGVMAAAGDLVIFIDADGATPITELPKMIQALRESDVAVGNRWMPGAKAERHSALRKLSGFVYRKYMSLFGLGEIDTMCGFKGYQTPVAKKLFQNLVENRWLFDAEIAYKAVQDGYKVTNFPIEWTSKDGSKLDTKTLLKTAFQIWPLIRRIKNS